MSISSLVSGAAEIGARKLAQRPIFHEVNFKFSPTVAPEQVAQAVKRFVALKTLSVNPQTGKPLIKSLHFGTNNSQEGLAKGFTHGFILKFANSADRDYYVGVDHTKPFDPAHDAFKQFVGPLLDGGSDGVMVLDFQDRVVLSPQATAATGTAKQ